VSIFCFFIFFDVNIRWIKIKLTNNKEVDRKSQASIVFRLIESKTEVVI
jgi:hypothetical protein